MIPAAYIEHQLPGRVRLRIPSRRGDVPYFQKVVQELSRHPAIRELSASPLTGSIMLQYLEPLQPITAAASDQRLFEASRFEPAAKADESTRSCRAGSGVTNGLATALSGLSLFQATQGNLFGSAAENFWHSFGAKRILGRPDLAAGFAALGIYQVLRGQLFNSATSLLFYALVMRQMAAMEEANARDWSAARTPGPAKSGAGAARGSEAGASAGTAGSRLRKPDNGLSS